MVAQPKTTRPNASATANIPIKPVTLFIFLPSYNKNADAETTPAYTKSPCRKVIPRKRPLQNPEETDGIYAAGKARPLAGKDLVNQWGGGGGWGYLFFLKNNGIKKPHQ
jgi:hypothetical protein